MAEPAMEQHKLMANECEMDAKVCGMSMTEERYGRCDETVLGMLKPELSQNREIPTDRS
jgi:hypothetical protein